MLHRAANKGLAVLKALIKINGSQRGVKECGKKENELHYLQNNSKTNY